MPKMSAKMKAAIARERASQKEWEIQQGYRHMTTGRRKYAPKRKSPKIYNLRAKNRPRDLAAELEAYNRGELYRGSSGRIVKRRKKTYQKIPKQFQKKRTANHLKIYTQIASELREDDRIHRRPEKRWQQYVKMAAQYV